MSAAENPGDLFNVKKVRRLIELMKEHDLSEITHSAPVIQTARPAAAAGATAPQPAADAGMLIIKSPMVGTFYKASGPDSAAFVKVGDRIGPEKTVCIVEAMKVFNEIPAGVSGQVVAILVENGAPVEFGQPLIKVDPGA
jgi:acetyl-CoA carboxylase biotin carboxyl carrier protein